MDKNVKTGDLPSTAFMKPRKRGGVSGPILFAVTVVAAIFVMSVCFRVNSITVVGNEHYTADEIINAIDIEEGDNLFFFDRFAAVSRVFAKLPYIEEVSVTRNLPDKVIVEVQESKALAYIKLGSELWTMDHNCKILGTAAEGEEESLIQIVDFDPGTFFIGETLNTEDGSVLPVNYLAEVLNQIQDRNMSSSVTDITFENMKNISFRYLNKYMVTLGDNYETELKFSMLLSAVDQLKDGDIGIIDVSDGATVHFQPY